MITINEEYIKSLPVTTNKLTIYYDTEKLFSDYSIVSYEGVDSRNRNLAYEQLSELAVLSVTGIRSKWPDYKYPITRFFVLIEKRKESEVLQSLRAYDFLRTRIDTFNGYSENQKNRIIASLAINSLGNDSNDRMMYCNGSLLISDDSNFGICDPDYEWVCLKIEVNEFMNLVARTTSFKHPRSIEELKAHINCVFIDYDRVGGSLWKGGTIKPVVIKNPKEGDIDLDTLYIQKKRYANDSKNIVPYLPFSPDKYIHGKLFVIWQVLDQVNKKFNGYLKLGFSDFPIMYYDSIKTGQEMMELILDYFKGKSIIFEDTYGTEDSRKYLSAIKESISEICETVIDFPDAPTGEEMIIRLCEPVESKKKLKKKASKGMNPENEQKEKSAEDSKYISSTMRKEYEGKALQHIIYDPDLKNETYNKNNARRISIELLVKNSLATATMPLQLRDSVDGWIFYRYKVKDGYVNGASMTVDRDGKINFRNYGMTGMFGEMFEQFIFENFGYWDFNKIKGSRDYMAMVKNGNVYLIVDTDEIPILDAELIDDAFGKVIRKEVTTKYPALMKQKNNAHLYLRGYMGFHLWLSEGIDGEPEGAYSYIVGKHRENIKIMGEMDKMPRVRRIFILNRQNPGSVKSDIMEISEMLKFGFGRWNEFMTYPYPFKFLLEYLNNVCRTIYSKDWRSF